MRNHYTTLGLETATHSDKEIKLAYKQLMLIHHPDKTNNKQLIDKGMQIIEAYNVLSDPVLREQYDAKLLLSIKKNSNLVNRHFDVIDRTCAK